MEDGKGDLEHECVGGGKIYGSTEGGGGVEEEKKENNEKVAVEKKKKKKRGRPRKKAVENGVTEGGGGVKEEKKEKKKRGRPRKKADANSSSALEDINEVKEEKKGKGKGSGRKRGRPRKIMKEVEEKKRPRNEFQLWKEENSSCGKRGIGQTSNLEDVKGEMVINGAMGELKQGFVDEGKIGAKLVAEEKKKRGRPKKERLVELQVEKEEYGATSSLGQGGISVAMVCKMEGEGGVQEEIQVQRGRGRPRKVVQKEENDANISLGQSSNLEDEEQHVKETKRRRQASEEVNLDGDKEKKKPGRKAASKPACEEQVETAEGQNDSTTRSLRDRRRKTQEPPPKPKPKALADENV